MPVMRQCADAVQAFDCRRRARRLHFTTLRQSYNIPANPTLSTLVTSESSSRKINHVTLQNIYAA